MLTIGILRHPRGVAMPSTPRRTVNGTSSFQSFSTIVGLTHWGTNSVVRHAVADAPSGPFVARRGVVQQAFHHNPSIVKAPDGTYLLYSIGNGSARPQNCTASTDEAQLGDPDAAGIISLSYSESINGPWNTLPDPILKGREGSWDSFVTNPSAYIFDNGTVLLAYRGGWSPWHIGIAVAPTWKGPYIIKSDQPVFKDINEDPGLFRDARGNFHMFTH